MILRTLVVALALCGIASAQEIRASDAITEMEAAYQSAAQKAAAAVVAINRQMPDVVLFSESVSEKHRDRVLDHMRSTIAPAIPQRMTIPSLKHCDRAMLAQQIQNLVARAQESRPASPRRSAARPARRTAPRARRACARRSGARAQRFRAARDTARRRPASRGRRSARHRRRPDARLRGRTCPPCDDRARTRPGEVLEKRTFVAGSQISRDVELLAQRVPATRKRIDDLALGEDDQAIPIGGRAANRFRRRLDLSSEPRLRAGNVTRLRMAKNARRRKCAG